MIIHSEDGLMYEVQWSIKTIQTTQHAITSDQFNTTGAELDPAQPQLVFFFFLTKALFFLLISSYSYLQLDLTFEEVRDLYLDQSIYAGFSIKTS